MARRSRRGLQDSQKGNCSLHEGRPAAGVDRRVGQVQEGHNISAHIHMYIVHWNWKRISTLMSGEEGFTFANYKATGEYCFEKYISVIN